MKLQWFLLGIFLAAVARNVFKAMRNPMLKNVLRLVSIPVALIITYILQVCGVFQHLLEYAVGMIDIASTLPEYEGIISNALGLIIPFITTSLSPLLITVCFWILYLIINIVHVNLVYRFLLKRQQKKKIKRFKHHLEKEKERMLKEASEQEKLIENGEDPNPEFLTHRLLDEEEIDIIVDQRIREEKKRLKKVSFFKESGTYKLISILSGALCAFFLFGITWISMFYSLDVLSRVTDGIDNTNADDTKIYRAVELVDKHIIEPYEQSFVYKLYDSTSAIDLMISAIREGGQIELDNGQIRYADDMLGEYLKRSVRLACEITSAKSEQSHVGQDISAMTKEPAVVSLIADVLVKVLDGVDAPEAGEGDILNALWANILGLYKGENGKEYIVKDLNAISDVVVIAVENKLLTKIISQETEILELLGDKELIKDFVGVLSGITVYGPTMQTAFTFGVDMMAPMLGLPADNAAAYDSLVNKLVSASSGVTAISEEDMAKLNKFFTEAASYQMNAGEISYVQSKIDSTQAQIDEINAKLNDTSLTLTDEEIADMEETIATLTANKTVLAAQMNALIEEREASTEKMSIYDYILDPIDVIKLIQEDGKQLKADAEDLETRANDLKSHSEVLQAQGEELKAKADELTQLESKIQSGNFTQEELERFEALVEEEAKLAEEGKDLASKGQDLAEEAEALAAEGEALAKDAEALASKAEVLIEQVEVYVASIEERIAGFTPFISYFMNWMNVQKPFMLAGEDTSTAPLALNVNGTLFICNTDILNIETLLDAIGNIGSLGGTDSDGTTDSNDPVGGDGVTDGDGTVDGDGTGEGEGTGEGSEGGAGDVADDLLNKDLTEFIDKIPMTDLLKELVIVEYTSTEEISISPLTSLIGCLISEASKDGAVIDNNWLISTLSTFATTADDGEAKKMAEKIVNAKDDPSSFEYLGVTLENLHDSLHFGEEWTDEAKKADGEQLVEIIFTLVDLIKGFVPGEGEGNTESPEGGETEGDSSDIDTSQIQTLLGLFTTLGKTMDQMADTTCLHDLPALVLESLLKNDMLSIAMTPSMLYGENGYMSRIESGDLSYEEFMNELVDMVSGLLDKLNNSNNEEVTE